MKFRLLKISDIDERATGNINALLVQLSNNTIWYKKENLRRIIVQSQMVLFVAFSGKIIIGMASIYFRQTLLRKTGIIEDVVVDKNYRGKGVGRKLTEMLIKEAKKQKINCVELTSNPKRKEAIAMYESMGFKKRETNCYRFSF